jgi:hypothetical protein
MYIIHTDSKCRVFTLQELGAAERIIIDTEHFRRDFLESSAEDVYHNDVLTVYFMYYTTGAVVSSSVVDAATGRELLMISMDPDRPVTRTGLHETHSAANGDDAQQLEQDNDQVRT